MKEDMPFKQRARRKQNMSKKFTGPNVDRRRLIDGPPLRGHVVQHSDAHHLLIIDGVVVPCTPTEYSLLLPLLEHVEEHVPFALLLNNASCMNRQTRRSLTQYMSRIRAKLWSFGFDIFCITGYGYTLLALPAESSEHEHESKRQTV